MLDYPALLALTEILRRGSFEAAAHALSVTPSAISQRIRTLEERCGMIMIDRGPPLRGTAAGLRLAAHLDQVRLLEITLDELNRDGQAPVIRVAVNADSLATWAIAPLTAAPGLLDLVIDDQDHAQHWLRTGQVVAAITAEPREVSGCDSVFLGTMRYRATASPDFAARYFPDGPDTDSLPRAPCLSFNNKDHLQDRWIKLLTGERLAVPLHRIPSPQAFAEAARLGIGWGMNPENLIAQDLASGRLVDLSPAHPLDVALYWQTARVMAPALADLGAAMIAAARLALRQATVRPLTDITSGPRPRLKGRNCR